MLGFWASSGGGVDAWTGLTDTPASITASRPVVGNSGGTALEFGGNALSDYLRRDGSNTITGNILPDGNQDRSLGAGDTRFDRIRGRLLTGLGASTSSGAKSGTDVGTRYYNNSPTGLVAGNMVEYGAGAATMQLGSGAMGFKPVAVVGNVWAGYGGGDTSLINNGGGSFLGGSAYSYGSGDCTVNVAPASFGSFTWAYSYGSGAGAHAWLNNGGGAILMGYSAGAGAVNVTASGAGSFTAVRPVASGGQVATVQNTGAGGFVNGFVNANTGPATLEVTANGGFAQGQVQNGGIIRASNTGGFAQGSAIGVGSDILASGIGTFAHGRANNGYAISAVGRGALAIGDANTAAIAAAGGNTFQFAPGVNNTPISIQLGQTTALGTGIHFFGNGAPAVPVNGDIWVDALGQITMQSGGVVCVATNAVM